MVKEGDPCGKTDWHPLLRAVLEDRLAGLADQVYSRPLPPPKPGTRFGPAVDRRYLPTHSVAAWARVTHFNAAPEFAAYQRGFADATKFYLRIG